MAGADKGLMSASAVLDLTDVSAALMPAATETRLRDSYGRAITDLRVSVTDRCNYRCVYCRTGNEGAVYEELAIAEYLRMIRVFVSLGIEKVRLTGGEPLLRRGLLELVQELGQTRTAFDAAGEPTSEGASLDVALTTNGHLLAGLAQPLKDAGLTRVTVSMDAVDAETFTAITRVPRSFDKVLAGVRAANVAGLGPVKVNCVLLRGFNDSQVERFAEFSRAEGVIVRFIEWMPLEEASTEVAGAGIAARRWSREAVVTLEEIVGRLDTYRREDWGGLVELPANAGERDGEAVYVWRRVGGDRGDCSGFATILRALFPGAVDVRWKDPDVSVLADGP